MQILNPQSADNGHVDAANAAKPDGEPQDSEFVKGVQKAIATVQERVDAAAGKEAEDAKDGFENVPKKIDVDANASADPILNVASSPQTKLHEDPRIAELDAISKSAIIEPRHKEAFIHAVISGERYYETFDLLGGKMHLVIRSRSTQETDAIIAYSRYMVRIDKIRTDYEYSGLMRKLLALAQVDEINGVKMAEMEAPLFFTENSKERVPPAWEPRIEQWAAKPESILAMTTRCILEFEARYWEMIRHIEDESFWLSEGSTGE